MIYTHRCARCSRTVTTTMAHFACGCDGGKPRLGDRMERMLAYLGGRQFKRAYRWLTGRDCGCDGRRRWLNRLSK